MSRVGVITQARTGSTRLPGKVLMHVGGKAILDHHLDRLEAAGLRVYVATTTSPADDPIVELVERRGVRWFRGSEDDVLSRFAGCAGEYDLETVVRVSSDCPLVDGELVRSAVDQFEQITDPWCYLSNALERTFPRGFDFEVFSAEALRYADEHARSPAEREHVTPYLYAGPPGRMTLRNIARDPDRSQYRVTLDTPADLRLITELIENHHMERHPADDIIALLDDHPELVAINAHIVQKAVPAPSPTRR